MRRSPNAEGSSGVPRPAGPSTANVNAAVQNATKPTQSYSAAISTGAQKPSRKPIVVGTMRSPPVPSTSAQSGVARSRMNIAAAKPFFGKAAYCVDNVSKDTTSDDIQQYVKSLGVRVLICNDAKPRRTYREKQNNITPDHKAFFLCINKADAQLLLDPSKWPADVSLSPWFFKKKDAEETTSSNQPAAAAQTDSHRAVVSAASNHISVAAEVHAPPSDISSVDRSVASQPAVAVTEQQMDLSAISSNANANVDQSDEFDEASDTLNGDTGNDAHNSTSVQIVDLSSIVTA